MSSLSHHGIKGQKWGIRRFQNKDGTRTAAGKARDYKKARELKQKAYDHYDKYGPAWRNKPVAARMYLKAERLEDPSMTPNESSAKANAISAQTVIDAVNLAEAIRSDPKLSDEDRAFYEDTVEQYLHKAAIYSYISDDIRFNFEEKDKPVTDREKDWNDYTSRQKEYLKKRVKDGDTWLHRYEQWISSPTAKHASIGGTMYIEGNALILGDSSYLEHHGILGQKWGVRRFQNKDGTRTAAGKARDQKKAAKTVKNARLFRASANAFQGTKFGAGANKRALKEEKAYGDMAFEILNNGKHKSEYDDLSRDIDAVASFEYEEYSKKRDAMIEINARISLEMGGIKNPSDEQVAEEWVYWADFDEDWGADLKGNSYDRYLVSKGYNPNEIHKRYKDDYAKLWDLASKDAEEYLGPYGDTKITYKDKYTKETVKTTAKEELANKIVDEATMWMDDYGAAKRADLVYTDKELSEMRAEDAKYSPLKHSALFIEDGTLYLSHHGIRGQRWGVRRFQNRDGSLTNAGRKRLGYATKGAAQTVGKAFKAGVKAGGNAVKAVKAHHEKKEAEKLQKKKDKASKTRIGVMANKDLFTNEEIRKLNERFKLEDEMKMATLQKGVEIAKAVGTIAQNVGTVAKTYEDVTGQSLSPIKRKAAEEKARQDKEDRERRIAREDADEARKVAKEERDIAIHEQTLRKAIASADTQEFTAQKTKAEADSSILDLYKKGQDFNGGSDASGQSWVEKAKNGGKNPFDDMIANRDPEYAKIRKEHDEKVARKERIAELERREKEREAEKAAAKKQNAPQQKQGGGDDDALFSQKGSLPIDKDRYRNNRAMEKAKQVKEDAAEERAKKQDEKAAKATIDDMMEARRQFTDSARANSDGAFDRETAANYIKGKAKELPSKLNPINAIAKKITNKALKEEEDNARKALEDEYKKTSRSQGRDEANYTMYYNRVNALQAQGYSERQAKKVADTENPFSSKRNRRFEYNEKVGEIETTHRKNSKEINKANKELTDYYYKLINGPGYDPGTPKREALDRKYAQKRGELEKLEKDNNDMLDREKKKAKKILEHSFTIQNGVLFVDSSDGFAHHGIKGQRWGVRRFQNPDGTLTPAGKKRDARRITKELNKNDKALAWEYRHISDRTHDYEHWDKQAKKAENKGNLDKAEKFKQRRDENSAKREEHRKNAKSMNEKTVSLISEAVKKGYDIKTKDTRRSVNTGGEIVANIALNVLAAAAGSPVLVARRKYVEGTKYKVKANNKATHYAIQDGALFVNAGEPYLEHHGVKGMKWGKHLMAGKNVEAGAGGGGGEDDEKLKEMAKKAGMSVAEYKQKFASKIGGAASKVGSAVKDGHLVINRSGSNGNARNRGIYQILPEDSSGTARPKAERKKITRKDVGEALYNAVGGNAKKAAQEHHRNMVNYKNEADKYSRDANIQGSAAKAHKRAGNVSGYIGAKTGARVDEENAKSYRLAQYSEAEEANKAQRKYDRSLAGLYDKATGKYKQVHKKTTTPSLSKQYQYYMKETNGKLFNHGNGKGSAKDQAKQAVWNAADNRILADDARAKKNDYYEDGGYGTAYRAAADKDTEKYGRAAEASYRRAAALGKQASSETSTSSRPRARKKRVTSGGSGVTVRRPGRKPVARTKRVTKSSTGVKRRGATGARARVRRGA